MMDHINVPTQNMDAARAFYDAVLASLDMVVIVNDGDAVGYGADSWVFGLVPARGDIDPLHFAFKAESESAVDAFYAAGLGAGGLCNGKPGTRPVYGPGYYACYLTDPDGHNVEAVCRDVTGGQREPE